ncbi:hypothetical protein ABPG75_010461 [Micractinium tetrahymenae]
MGSCRLPAATALTAVCALALDASAAAKCTQGTISFALVNAANASTAGNMDWLRTCLPAFTVKAYTNCSVSITAGSSAAGAYVPQIWSSFPAGTQPKALRACPTAEGAAVAPAGSTQASMQAAIKSALEKYVYGGSYDLATTSTDWSNSGYILVAAPQKGAFPSTGGPLKYAIINTPDGSLATAVGTLLGQSTCSADGSSGPEASKGECVLQILPLLSPSCAAGRYEVVGSGMLGLGILGYKICPLCKAGTWSASGASSCTACSAGRFFMGLGAGSSAACSSCAMGYYASGTGNSECQPCDAGMYLNNTGGTSSSACQACPAGSYAYWPGSSHCLNCVNGVPACVAGYDGGLSACNSVATPSEGYHILQISTRGTLRTCAASFPSLGAAYPPAMTRCDVTADPAPAYLMAYVTAACQGPAVWQQSIYPIKDKTCSEPSAGSSWSISQLGAAGHSYSYSSLLVGGFYISASKIATRLALTGTASAYQLSLDTFAGSTLSLKIWAASTNITQAATLADTVAGGTSAWCTNGYASPVGSYCPAGGTEASSATQCSAGTFQPYLGQAAPTDCWTCDPVSNGNFTSEADSDYCTFPVSNVACYPGEELDVTTLACRACPAGTYRSASSEAVCVACNLGTYSAANSSSCTACPVGQFSDIFGLAEQSSGAAQPKCFTCPTGYVPKDASGATGNTGSSYCGSCPAGTQPNAATGTCDPCASGYIRIGESSETSYACMQIPPGYKAVAATPLQAVEPCGYGEVSYYSSGSRVPATTTQCQPCTGGSTYAPHKGMSACVACPSGTYPTKSNATYPSNDQCSKCSTLLTNGVAISYWPASDTTGVCLVCLAGNEVQGGGKSCIPCKPGYYNPPFSGSDNSARYESCQPCQQSWYADSDGQTACSKWPAGTATQGTGSSS